MNLDEFVERFESYNLAAFKMFWIAQNQIDAIAFPIVQNKMQWLDAYETWKEGGYGL